MTIFGVNNEPDISVCNHTVPHNATSLDTAMNYGCGAILTIAVPLSIVGNICVIFLFKNRRYPSLRIRYPSFRVRSPLFSIRALFDLVYCFRTVFILYNLLKPKLDPLCSSDITVAETVVHRVLDAVCRFSGYLTFNILVSSYLALLLPFACQKYSLRRYLRVVVGTAAICLETAIQYFKSDQFRFSKGHSPNLVWFSPTQLSVAVESTLANVTSYFLWTMFSAKVAVLVLHIIITAHILVMIFRMSVYRRITLVNVINRVSGNCIWLILSVVLDLKTNFLDLTYDLDTITGMRYDYFYLVFWVDVMLPSLLSAYNPVVLLWANPRLMILVKRNVARLRETLTCCCYGYGSVTACCYEFVTEETRVSNRRVTELSHPHIRSPAQDQLLQARRRASSTDRPNQIINRGRHNQNEVTYSTEYELTCSLYIWTTIGETEHRDPVVEDCVKFDLAHMPNTPTISIPVPVLLEPYAHLRLVGRGFFGNVYRFTDPDVDCSVAVKHIQIEVAGARKEVENVKKEVRINMMKLSHANIVQYVGCCDSEESSWCIILEYMDHGAIKTRLNQRLDELSLERIEREGAGDDEITDEVGEPGSGSGSSLLPEDLILKYSQEMAAGLAYLHEQGVLHRDLRAANVLLSARDVAKIADFGLSKKLEAVSKKTGTYTGGLGNVYWRSPEIMNCEEEKCGPAGDVWSLGVTILEMVHGRPPFMEDEIFRYERKLVRHKKLPEIPAYLRQEVQELLGRCLVYDVGERWQASRLFPV